MIAKQTAISRYRIVVKNLCMVLFYAVAAVVVIGVNPMRGQTVTPFDLLISQRAWSAVDPGIQVRQGERSDVLDSRLPIWINTRDQIRRGHLPLWDDVNVSGSVALMTINSSMWTPAYAAFVAMPDTADGFYLATLLDLVIAGVGMHMFLRRRLGMVAAVAGALTFEFCGFHAAWLYWPHVQTSIWAPWLLLAVAMCAGRPSGRASLGVALASAMVILGGFPFVGMMVFGASALYAAVLAVARWRSGHSAWPMMGWYAAGIAFGFVLCALPLIGFVHWLGQYNLDYRHGGSLLGLDGWRLLFPPWSYATRRVEYTMYVGLLITVLAFLALPAIVLRRRKIDPLPVFGLMLLLVAAGLVFGFWPKSIVDLIPGMASNVWTRAICILDLALVILGAWMLNVLWGLGTLRTRPWVRCMIVVIAVAQVLEIGAFFHLYNGPVAKRDVYPSTPAIAYMQKHSGPFDTVVADKSFLISGTLGAYGLREWFAHHFKSDAVKQALTDMADHPFASPTASRLDASQIRLSSPTMDAFNVRYVALDSRADPYAEAPPVPSGAKHRPLPNMPSHRYTQRFTLRSARQLDGISVKLATYRKSHFHGSLTLTLRDAAGQELATDVRDARTVSDNSMERFHFRAPVFLKPGTYAFSLSYEPRDERRPLTAWTYVARHKPHNLSVNGRPRAGRMQYLLHGPTSEQPFTRVFQGPRVSVYENMRSPNGPYVLSALKDVPDADSGKEVHVVSYRAGRFVLDYVGHAQGYVVVPMNMREGWRVHVNDTAVRPMLKQGVMPAVRVTGPSRIEFSYQSTVSGWVVPWLLLVSALTAFMFYVDWRLGHPLKHLFQSGADK